MSFFTVKWKKWFGIGLPFLFLIPYLLFPHSYVSASSTLLSMMKDQQSPIFGDYGGELRETKPRADGIHHVDTPRLIEKLKELKVNTYYFLIWHESSDWDDLRKEFLPAAEKANINVWVYLVPPSEARLKRSEPFGTDYVSWFRAVGRLSRHFSHLKGIVIDDFNDNLLFFNPSYLQKMRLAGRSENPDLQFYPQVYYPAVSHTFVEKIRAFIDGLVMTFRDDHYRNTQRIDRLIKQIDEVQSILHYHQLPFVLMIYASRLSATPANPSTSYVEGALKIGLERLMLKQIQGVITYILVKEFDTETNDHLAYSGMGYANFFSPLNQKGKESDFVQLSQTVQIGPTGPYSLSFVHSSIYPSTLHPDSFVKQIFIDHKLVWEQKSKSSLSDKWVHVSLNLTPYLQGKRSAVLTFRLSRLQSAPTYWMFAGIDQLRSSGFYIKNADFEEKREWTVESNCRNLLADIHIYDPKRSQKTFDSVRKHFNAFYLYQQIHQQTLHPYLTRISQHMLTGVLLNQYQTTLDTIKEMMRLILFDKNISPDQKQQLLEECRQFYRSIKSDMKTKEHP